MPARKGPTATTVPGLIRWRAPTLRTEGYWSTPPDGPCGEEVPIRLDLTAWWDADPDLDTVTLVVWGPQEPPEECGWLTVQLLREEVEQLRARLTQALSYFDAADRRGVA